MFPVEVPLNKTIASYLLTHGQVTLTVRDSKANWSQRSYIQFQVQKIANSTHLLKCSQDEAYTCLPLPPTVHMKSVHGKSWHIIKQVTLLQRNKYDIKCTYVTSQLFFRRRFSQPPWTHHIPPTHICSFLALWSLSGDFGLASFVLGVSSCTWRRKKDRWHKT